MSFRGLTPWLSRRHGVLRSPSDNPMQDFYREMDRVFEGFFGDFGLAENGKQRLALVPSVDVAETDKAFEITADLPGVEEKDVEVTVSDGLLTMKGEKKTETEQTDKNYHRAERSYGAFTRSISLPAEIDEAKIAACFKNGVLTVTLPKKPDAKARFKRIDVKAA